MDAAMQRGKLSNIVKDGKNQRMTDISIRKGFNVRRIFNALFLRLSLGPMLQAKSLAKRRSNSRHFHADSVVIHSVNVSDEFIDVCIIALFCLLKHVLVGARSGEEEKQTA
ncbi:hypothetical protein HG531_007034 [Fusarium graminearum]|nr:hypothetical protein HG531_007034 [Fusarium graminearum]